MYGSLSVPDNFMFFISVNTNLSSISICKIQALKPRWKVEGERIKNKDLPTKHLNMYICTL